MGHLTVFLVFFISIIAVNSTFLRITHFVPDANPKMGNFTGSVSEDGIVNAEFFAYRTYNDFIV